MSFLSDEPTLVDVPKLLCLYGEPLLWNKEEAEKKKEAGNRTLTLSCWGKEEPQTMRRDGGQELTTPLVTGEAPKQTRVARLENPITFAHPYQKLRHFCFRKPRNRSPSESHGFQPTASSTPLPFRKQNKNEKEIKGKEKGMENQVHNLPGVTCLYPEFVGHAFVS